MLGRYWVFLLRKVPFGRAMAVAIALAGAGLADAAGAAAESRGSGHPGLAIYKDADCMACHKWHGAGGGGYGGAALSLRATTLSRDDILTVIQCGRPSTNMPYHDRSAYDDDRCYGLVAADLGEEMMPPPGRKYLRPAQREIVADYVVEELQGRGDPTLDDCYAFWGEGSRNCRFFSWDSESKGGGGH